MNYRSDKLDPICRKNFVAGSHPDSFRYIPRYLTEYLSQLTFIQQIPIFTFPNKIEVLLKAEHLDGYFCWAVSVSFGNYSFEKFPDFDCTKFNKNCHTLDELLAGLYFIPEDVAASWIKTLKNNKRKTWKTDEEIFLSDKFQKVFASALEKGIAENKKSYPFLLPELQNDDDIEYKRITNMDYTIVYKCGVSVSSKKWGNGYTVIDKNASQAKPLILDSIDMVNDFIRNRQIAESDENVEKSLEKVSTDSIEDTKISKVDKVIVQNDEKSEKPETQRKIKARKPKVQESVEDNTATEKPKEIKVSKTAKRAEEEKVKTMSKKPVINKNHKAIDREGTKDKETKSLKKTKVKAETKTKRKSKDDIPEIEHSIKEPKKKEVESDVKPSSKDTKIRSKKAKDEVSKVTKQKDIPLADKQKKGTKVTKETPEKLTKTAKSDTSKIK